MNTKKEAIEKLKKTTEGDKSIFSGGYGFPGKHYTGPGTALEEKLFKLYGPLTGKDSGEIPWELPVDYEDLSSFEHDILYTSESPSFRKKADQIKREAIDFLSRYEKIKISVQLTNFMLDAKNFIQNIKDEEPDELEKQYILMARETTIAMINYATKWDKNFPESEINKAYQNLIDKYFNAKSFILLSQGRENELIESNNLLKIGLEHYNLYNQLNFANKKWLDIHTIEDYEEMSSPTVTINPNISTFNSKPLEQLKEKVPIISLITGSGKNSVYQSAKKGENITKKQLLEIIKEWNKNVQEVDPSLPLIKVSWSMNKSELTFSTEAIVTMSKIVESKGTTIKNFLAQPTGKVIESIANQKDFYYPAYYSSANITSIFSRHIVEVPPTPEIEVPPTPEIEQEQESKTEVQESEVDLQETKFPKVMGSLKTMEEFDDFLKKYNPETDNDLLNEYIILTNDEVNRSEGGDIKFSLIKLETFNDIEKIKKIEEYNKILPTILSTEYRKNIIDKLNEPSTRAFGNFPPIGGKIEVPSESSGSEEVIRIIKPQEDEEKYPLVLRPTPPAILKPERIRDKEKEILELEGKISNIKSRKNNYLSRRIKLLKLSNVENDNVIKEYELKINEYKAKLPSVNKNQAEVIGLEIGVLESEIDAVKTSVQGKEIIIKKLEDKIKKIPEDVDKILAEIELKNIELKEIHGLKTKRDRIQEREELKNRREQKEILDVKQKIEEEEKIRERGTPAENQVFTPTKVIKQPRPNHLSPAGEAKEQPPRKPNNWRELILEPIYEPNKNDVIQADLQNLQMLEYPVKKRTEIYARDYVNKLFQYAGANEIVGTEKETFNGVKDFRDMTISIEEFSKYNFRMLSLLENGDKMGFKEHDNRLKDRSQPLFNPLFTDYERMTF